MQVEITGMAEHAMQGKLKDELECNDVHWCRAVPASELDFSHSDTVIQQSETKAGQCMEGRPPFHPP